MRTHVPATPEDRVPAATKRKNNLRMLLPLAFARTVGVLTTRIFTTLPNHKNK